MQIDGIKGVTFLKPSFINKILMEKSGNLVYDHEAFGQIRKWCLVHVILNRVSKLL